MGTGAGMLIGGLAQGGKGLVIGGAVGATFDGCALARKEAFGSAAVRNRVDDGVESPAGDDSGACWPVTESGVGTHLSP